MHTDPYIENGKIRWWSSSDKGHTVLETQEFIDKLLALTYQLQHPEKLLELDGEGKPILE